MKNPTDGKNIIFAIVQDPGSGQIQFLCPVGAPKMEILKTTSALLEDFRRQAYEEKPSNIVVPQLKIQ